MTSHEKLQKLTTLIRYFILTSTTKAASGHATSSLSATDLMTMLMFGGFFKADLENPQNPNNDRLIFSKGHASPLFYSLYAAAGAFEASELDTLRTFGSRLEGHPTLMFPYTEVPTGSLGQGLSVGLGMALNAKYLDKTSYRTYVLLGDSEMAEGSVWEALESAAFYKANNLVAIIDVNRLGQRGETMLGYDTESYYKKVTAFGWEAVVIDGHSLAEIKDAFSAALKSAKPFCIIAKTTKGKGVSFLEDTDGWHGKALSKEELAKALPELGEVNLHIRGKVAMPENISVSSAPTLEKNIPVTDYTNGKAVSTRKAYGNTLLNLAPLMQNIVVLDAETSNSTYAETMKKVAPERFFEMYIAEQNMVGTALGLAKRGKLPFVSTFAAFFSRAFDQIRMSQYAGAHLVFVGSHAGVSIGEDGASQMALEDIALFRTLHNSTVLYPSDAVAAEKCIVTAANHDGLVYVRTTRKDTHVLYPQTETFPVGGSKTLRASSTDAITLVGAGITVHEALAAHGELMKAGIAVRVIDLYSIKPIDSAALHKAVTETGHLLVIEDHYAEGGIAEAVRSALGDQAGAVTSLAVTKQPKSGKPEELLEYEGISSSAIVNKAKELLARK